MGRIQSFIVRRRVGRIAALAGLLLGAMAYTSYGNRTVLGRYSPAFAAVLAVVASLLVAVVIRSIVAPRRSHAEDAEALVFELACACWGLGYLSSAIYDPSYGARLLDLNLFGSPFPGSALFEYLAVCLLLANLILAGARLGRGAALSWGLVAATVAVLALLGEGVARAAAFIGAQTRGIPSFSGMVFDHRYVRLNHEGFRDQEHTRTPHPGTRRLLLVGDSYAFGAGIRDTSERFGEQLRVALARASGDFWEVVNASAPGRNTIDEIAFLERGLAYSPHAVLLLYVFNDANYLEGRQALVGGGVSPVRAEPDQNPIFELPRSVGVLLSPSRLLYWNSFLFQEVYVRWRSLDLKLARWRGLPQSPDVYRTPELLQLHLTDLGHFVRIADSAQTPVWILPIDQGVPSDSDRTDRQRKFVEAARAAGLPVLTLGDAYRGRDINTLVVNPFDGHPNALGIRLAVAEIAPRLLVELGRAMGYHPAQTTAGAKP